MKPLHKVLFVAGGYVVCLLLASAVVLIRVVATSGAARQAAGGMYGFGDTILFVGAFGVPALVPTGAALIFLRPYRPFWAVLAASGVALALTGVGAAILFAVGRGVPTSRLATWAGLSVLRILIAPLLALAFFVCAVLSPNRRPRLALLTAAVMEAAVSAYAGFVWVIPQFFHAP